MHNYNAFWGNKKLCLMDYNRRCLLVVIHYNDVLLQMPEKKETDRPQNNRIANLEYLNLYKTSPPILNYTVIPGFVKGDELKVDKDGGLIRSFSVDPVEEMEKKDVKQFLKQKGLDFKLNFW